MLVERPSGEGQRIGQQHKSLGRRVREYSAVLTLAPGVFLGSGLPAVSALQEASLQPPAIVTHSTMEFTQMQSLTALDGTFPTTLTTQNVETNSDQVCGSQPVIPADQVYVYSEGFDLYSGVPNGIKMTEGEKLNQNGTDWIYGTLISTDNGQNFTFVEGILPLNGANNGIQLPPGVWSPHTTNGRPDLFVGLNKDGLNGFSNQLLLLYSPDGCQWDVVASANTNMDLSDGVQDITWSADGTSVAVDVQYESGYYGSQLTGTETVTLSLNGDASVKLPQPPSKPWYASAWDDFWESGVGNACLRVLEIAGVLYLVMLVAAPFMRSTDRD